MPEVGTLSFPVTRVLYLTAVALVFMDGQSSGCWFVFVVGARKGIRCGCLLQAVRYRAAAANRNIPVSFFPILLLRLSLFIVILASLQCLAFVDRSRLYSEFYFA